MKAKGTRPKSDKWKAAYELPVFEPMDEPPDLPDGWDWIRLGLLGENPLMTVQTGPFGAQLHNDEFTADGVPVIAVGNLTGMGFKRDGLYFVPPKKAEQLCRYDVHAGDVLFARSGATLGKVCVAPGFVRDWRMTGHILRVRLNATFVIPDIVVFAMHGDPSVRYQVSGNVRGITRPGFNTTLLESIVVPIAPLAEQHEIVRRVEKLFAFADQIEARLTQAQTHVDRLTQSLLRKAFRGELVPTEHTLATAAGREYESAFVLLDRIHSERSLSQPVGRQRTKPAGTR